MRSLLTVSALAFLSYGLWSHDWTVIGASLVLVAVWPLIENDVRMRESAKIDRSFWEAVNRSDDDLSDSA